MKELLSTIGILFFSLVIYGNIVRGQVGIPFPGPGAASSAKWTFLATPSKCFGSTNANGFTSSVVDTTGAKIIIAFPTTYHGDGGPTFTDNQSNSYSSLTVQSNATGSRGIFFYKGLPTTNASHTFTIGVGAGNEAAFCLAVFSGGTLSSPFDVENGTTGTSGTSAPGTKTPNANNEVCVIGSTGAGDNLVTLTGATSVDTPITNTANHYATGVGYSIQTTAAAFNPSWTLGSSVAWASASACFKPQ